MGLRRHCPPFRALGLSSGEARPSLTAPKIPLTPIISVPSRKTFHSYTCKPSP